MQKEDKVALAPDYPYPIIVTQPMAGSSSGVNSSPYGSAWANVVCSVFSMFCCGVFGAIATVMSLLAYADFRTGLNAYAGSKRKVAWGFAITAIVLGTIFLVGCIVLYIHFPEHKMRMMRAGRHGWEDNDDIIVD